MEHRRHKTQRLSNRFIKGSPRTSQNGRNWQSTPRYYQYTSASTPASLHEAGPSHTDGASAGQNRITSPEDLLSHSLSRRRELDAQLVRKFQEIEYIVAEAQHKLERDRALTEQRVTQMEDKAQALQACMDEELAAFEREAPRLPGHILPRKYNLYETKRRQQEETIIRLCERISAATEECRIFQANLLQKVRAAKEALTKECEALAAKISQENQAYKEIKFSLYLYQQLEVQQQAISG